MCGKMHEQFVSEVFEAVGNSYKVLGIYTGALKKIKIRHESCGHEYEVTPNGFLRGRRCPNCFGARKYSQKEIKEWLSSFGYAMVGDYKNANKCVLVKTADGYLFTIRIPNLRNGQGITIFGKSNPYTISNIKLWCELNNKHFKLESDEYKGSTKGLRWKCSNLDCGELFLMSWSSVSQGRSCPYCAGKKVGALNNLAKNNPALAVEWDYIKNGSLTPHEVLPGSDKKVWWRCGSCGHRWEAAIGNRSRGTGCPKCFESKGEKTISDYLASKKLNFVREYRIEECRHLRPLPFDFAVFIKSNLLCLIEYDGEQHFRAIGRLRMNEFMTIKKRDTIKNNFCKSKGIPLIRIPYMETDIEGFLDKELAGLKIKRQGKY